VQIGPGDRIDSQAPGQRVPAKGLAITRILRSLFVLTFTLLASSGVAWWGATDLQRERLVGFLQQGTGAGEGSFAEFSAWLVQWVPFRPNLTAASQPGQTADGRSAEREAREQSRPNACGRVSSQALEQRMVVYQWRDAQDRESISDQPPTHGYFDLRLKNVHIDNYFKLKIDDRHADLPAFTQDRVSAGVTQIYKTFSQVIKVVELRNIELNIRFFSDPAKFHAYRLKVAPDTSSKATGFYSARLNESVILAQGSREHIVSLALHESTHAIVAAMFGGAPHWLNEGMAGLFDSMRVNGEQTRIFETNAEYLELLKHTRLPSLAAHFTQIRVQWYDPANIDLNYAIDWSLAYFLMSSPYGRDFLRYMLDSLAVNYCQDFSTVAFAHRHYPGGVNALEKNWKAWLRQVRPGTLKF
jgi:hypothetical protein